jgi:hypothetical protein
LPKRPKHNTIALSFTGFGIRLRGEGIPRSKLADIAARKLNRKRH